MPKCGSCDNFDKKLECCGLEPSEIEDTCCLLRWVISLMLEQMEDDNEGEDWKFR
jgi:hypothetical protein